MNWIEMNRLESDQGQAIYGKLSDGRNNKEGQKKSISFPFLVLNSTDTHQIPTPTVPKASVSNTL